MSTTETYNYTVVRQFSVMTVIWGIVGMLVGVMDRRPAGLPGAELRHALD
jgi:cbb3-type cytochrome oxidase subunit 1